MFNGTFGLLTPGSRSATVVTQSHVRGESIIRRVLLAAAFVALAPLVSIPPALGDRGRQERVRSSEDPLLGLGSVAVSRRIPTFYADPVGDNKGGLLGPDLTAIAVDDDPTTLFISVTILNAFQFIEPGSEYAGVYLNTDGLASTGDPSRGGADYLIGSRDLVDLWRWAGARWEYEPEGDVGARLVYPQLIVTASRADIGNPSAVSFRLYYSTPGGSDEAPNDGSYTYVMRSAAPPPPPPPPPPPDVTPPNTRITAAPKRRTTAHRATFRFRSTEAGSTFRCKLDRRPWRRCTSPKRYRNLRLGRHTFRVRAWDRAGNADPTPAIRRWSITRPTTPR